MGQISGGGGGGGTASQGYQYSGNLNQALQQIWAPQAQALSSLYGGVTGLQQQQAGQVPGAAMAAANRAMPGQMAGVNNLTAMAGGNVGALNQYAQPNNALAQRQLGQYSQQVGQNFARQIMPQLRTGAGLTGNMGGSRLALAQGVAAGDAARTIQQGATDLYAQQYGIGAQAAQGLGQMRLGAAQALPGAATSGFNLAMAPYQAAWAPYTASAGIFGGPTALSTQQSLGFGEDWSAGIGNPRKNTWGFGISG